MTPRPPLFGVPGRSAAALASATSRFRIDHLGVKSETYLLLRCVAREAALSRVFDVTVDRNANPRPARASVSYHGLAAEDQLFHALWRRR